MSLDLFTKARIKITFLYFLLGIVIVAIAGYLIYSDLTAIIANTLKTLQELLHAGININQNTAATLITQNIDSQLKQMDLAVGIWLIVAMVFSAYVLAGITLRPAKRTMERQKRFMANISHELRTPLSVMKTTTEATLLGADQLTREELIESKKSDIEEIDRMAKIIEFLFNFSNFENRKDRLTFSSVDLADVAQKAIGLMKNRAEDKNITISLATQPATVSGNYTALEEIVVNLIKNAIAYTPAGGSVKVIVAQKYGAKTISVKDNGAGISAKDIPNIFEAFYRGSHVTDSYEQNSGLGLALVREIATLHGATILVKSAIGKGTTITLKFPGRFSRWLTSSLPWS